MQTKKIEAMFFVIIVFIMFFSIIFFLQNKTIIKNEIETREVKEQIEKNIVLGITQFDTLNPISSTSYEIQYITKLLYNPLINIAENFELAPGLAEEWNKLDSRTYLIKLYDNKYWSNGKAVTSYDVQYTIEYIKQNDGIYKSNVQNIERIDVVDDKIFKLLLKEKEDNFEYMLCFPIINEKIDLYTGEYNIKNITENEVLLENKKNTQQMIIRIYKNLSDLYNSFLNKKVDFIITRNINFTEYIGKIGYKKEIICGREYIYIKFNLNNRITKEPEVVEAIKYAINKDEINSKIFNNFFISTDCPWEHESSLAEKNQEYEFNVNRAKEILKENGWRLLEKHWIKNGQVLRLDIITDEKKEKIAQIIKSEIEILGIETNVIIRNNLEQYNNNSNYGMVLTEKTVSIKPEYYGTDEKNSSFLGLCCSSIILLHSENMKGDFSGNWYNIFYNIDTWYKIN